MLSIKKTSLFFNKSIILQGILIKKGFLAFYDYFEMDSFKIFFFKSFVQDNKFDFIILNTSFISFFFSNNFFNFIRPGLFLVAGDVLNDFFVFNNKVKENFSYFLLSLSFNGFFFNFNFLNTFQKILDIFCFKNY